jgi:hypothetical protein
MSNTCGFPANKKTCGFSNLQNDIFLALSCFSKKKDIILFYPKWHFESFTLLIQCFLSLSNHAKVTPGSHKHHKWMGPAIRMSLPSFRLGKTNRIASVISQKKTAKSLNMYKRK